MMSQVLLELYCFKESGNANATPHPCFCTSTECIPSYNCIKNQCSFLGYTYCENTLCYTDENAEVLYGISFGGEMENRESNDRGLKKWKEISIDKINEAYQEYMGQGTVNVNPVK